MRMSGRGAEEKDRLWRNGERHDGFMGWKAWFTSLLRIAIVPVMVVLITMAVA